MPINVAAGRTAAGEGYITDAQYMSLHTGVPGSGGSNEVVGGAPAYARLPITWTPGTAGTWTATVPSDFDVPPGVTVNHIGLWTDDVGGTFVDYAAIDPATYTLQGTLEITDITFTMS